MGKRTWSRQENDILEENYGKLTIKALRKKLERETGRYRSPASVACQANALKLDHRTNQAGVTIADAARELDVTCWLLYRMVDSGEIKTFGRGKCRYIDFDDLEGLRAKFPPAPARSMTPTQAREILGYGETQMLRLIHAGVVRAVRRGERWCVDADHVDQLAKEMRRKGLVRLDLSGFRGLDEERAKTREYCRSYRNIQRAEQTRQERSAIAASFDHLSAEEIEVRLEQLRQQRTEIRAQLRALRSGRSA